MQGKIKQAHIIAGLLVFGACFFSSIAAAEVKILESDTYTFTAEPYERTDFIMMENAVDLDTKIRDDRVQYIGIDYHAAFDIQIKNNGPELYFMLERRGVYDYDTPVIIHNTLQTYLGKIGPYTNAELLPKMSKCWIDLPLSPEKPIHIKTGLFTYGVGHGVALTGSYENYGVELSAVGENVTWRSYYCWPDISNKPFIGPYIKQEKPQGIDYEHSKAYFFATDMTITVLEKSVIQPYIGALLDLTDTKRLNLFQTPTRQDCLATAGISGDLVFDKLTIGLEFAQNFGGAQSSDGNFPDVIHCGHAFFAEGTYDLGRIVPRAQFVYSSGNKLTTDMITNGDTLYPSGKNCGFSTYSPLNAYLADSIYAELENAPLVAMGGGVGLNYGVPRPTTFLDPRILENIILCGVGFDYKTTKNISCTFAWWYLANAERGIGMYNNVPKVLSPDLGNEVDLYVNYKVNERVKFLISSGIYFPGAAYREERTDTRGSLFTPYVRGDGKPDPAYQLEAGFEITF